MTDTPTTPAGLHSLDDLDPAEAIVHAWTEPGPQPGWHRYAVIGVRRTMPLLARQLDRLAEQHPEWASPRWRPGESG